MFVQLSDRYGRRIVIFVAIFGLFVTDVTHVITAWFVDVLPLGYWFPLVGYLIEGVCGSEFFAQQHSFEGYSAECNIHLHAQVCRLGWQLITRAWQTQLTHLQGQLCLVSVSCLVF